MSYHNLKPVPAFHTKQDKKHQATIFAADEADKSGDFEYTPHEPLQWWYSKDQGGSWQHVPPTALVQLDQNLRVVQLLPDQLEGSKAQLNQQFLVAVTEDAERKPTKSHALEIDVARLPPAVPFRIEGAGTIGGQPNAGVDVALSRARVPNTKDEILWVVIRNSSNALSFNAYQDFMDSLFASPRFNQAAGHDRRALTDALELGEPFVASSIDAHKVLKAATELFVMTRCGVMRPPTLRPDALEEEGRFGHRLPAVFQEMWESYLTPSGNIDGRQAHILPYLDLIRRKLGDLGTSRASSAGLIDRQVGLIQDKLVHPILLELIWSYWHEEGMLVQSFNTITRRFQNVRSNGERDPLAQLELDPLRPVTNLLWGWVQEEQANLSVLRRAHEYDHQYGFTLHGKAIAELRTVDRRSKFLESFHNLLWRCAQFYHDDDNTMRMADAFPVLNALKETHYLLAQGAHNQFGNLPSQARQDMLMQQWILSRPEVREFLGTRVMVPYPEAWMDRVDAVKTLKGWTDTSVVHFRDLATFGEQVLLSIRWGAWSTIDQPSSAANWARYWRAEIQGYIHAYRVATSVDLTADMSDTRQAETRFLPPSVHLRNRLLAQAPSTSR